MKSARKTYFLCGACSLLFVQPALAQNSAAPSSTPPLPTAQSQSADDAPDAEAVVVTGSMIRTFQPSSPVQMVGRDDLIARAPQSLGNLLAELPANSGASVMGARGAINSSGGASVNLRGLGPSATLVLLNSKRQAPIPTQASVVDVNGLTPQIMIQRVEVLKDGSSAIYGTDAVGGVVNILTRDSFSGLELQAQTNFLTSSGKNETRLGLLYGKQADRWSVVLGLEGNIRDRLPTVEVPGIEGLGVSTGPWQPGVYTVPNRDAAGNLRAGAGSTRSVIDPYCGETPQTGYYPIGASASNATSCYYQSAPDNDYYSGEQRISALLRAHYDVTDDVKLTLELGHTNNKLQGAQSSSGSISSTVIVPGHNPGNTFRAVDSAGRPLFAVADANNPALPMRNAAGRVVLTANPLDPSSGIAFNEDIIFSGRALGSQGGLPTQGNVAAGAFAASRPSEDQVQIYRGVVGLSGSLANSWTWDLAGTYSRQQIKNNGLNNNLVFDRFLQAINGYGGENCNASAGVPGSNNCLYFNPFGSSSFAAPGSAQANSQDVIDYFARSLWDKYRSTLFVADATIGGELAQLPAGPLSIALGLQYRRATWMVDYDAVKNAGNTETGTTFRDVDAVQATKVIFGEIAAPIFDTGFGRLDFNAAGRYEDGGEGQRTFNPKLGLLYKTAGGGLTLRGSWGKSFLSPSLFQRYTSSSSFAFVNDPVSGQRPRVTVFATGNPDLKPQKSTAFSVGGTIRAFDGLVLDVSYWSYNFKDLIALRNAQQILSQDPNGPLVIRDVSGVPNLVYSTYFNASGVKTSGIDAEISYPFDLGSAGDLRLSASASYIATYKLQTNPGGAFVDRGGNLNSTTFASPSVPLRAQARADWTHGNNALSATIRYVDGIDNDRVYAAQAFPVTPTASFITDAFGAYMPVDISYSRTFSPGVLGSESVVFTVGVQNVFQTLPDPTLGGPNDAASVYDYRGRIAFARFSTAF